MGAMYKWLCYISAFIIPVIGMVLFFSWLETDNTEKRRIGIQSLYLSIASVSLIWAVGTVSFYLRFYMGA